MELMRTVRACLAGVLLLAGPVLADAPPGLEDLIPGGVYDPSAPSWKGQAGMTFLQIPAGARPAGMGDAFIGMKGDPSIVFYNPAGVASLIGTQFYVNYTNWFADMNLTDVAITSSSGIFSYGLTFHNMDYGVIQATTINEVQGTGTDYVFLGDLNPSAWAAGIVFGVRFTDRFQAGAQFKYGVEDFGTNDIYTFLGTPRYTGDTNDNRVGVFMFDLGTQYDTGMRGLHVNMALQHFGQSPTYVITEFELPLTYRVGLSFDAIEMISGDKDPDNLVYVDLEGVDRRDVKLDWALGVEYRRSLSQVSEGMSVAARVGRKAARYQEGWLTAGFGATMMVPSLGQVINFDYAYEDYGADLSAQFFSFRLSL